MLCKHYLHKLYHTLLPSERKVVALHVQGLHKRTAVCTVFIFFPFKIIQLTCIIFLTKHRRIHTASYTAVVLYLLDAAITNFFFFFAPETEVDVASLASNTEAAF